MGVAPYIPIIPKDWRRLEFINNALWTILNSDTNLSNLVTIDSDVQVELDGVSDVAVVNASNITWMESDIDTNTSDIVVVKSDVTTNASDIAVVAGTIPGGADTQVIYVDGTALAGDGTFTFNKTTKDVTMQGLIVTSCLDFGSDSAIFQPNADSTTFFQVKDKDGNTFANIDTTNELLTLTGGIGSSNPQLKIAFDASNFTTLKAASDGSLTLAFSNIEQFIVKGDSPTIRFQMAEYGSASFNFYQQATRRAQFQYVDAGDNLRFISYYGGVLFKTGSAGTAVDRMYIDSGGIFNIYSTDASDQIQIYHDNTNAYFRTVDGNFIFQTDEGTNTNTVLRVVGKGTGIGFVVITDEDGAEGLEFSASAGRAEIKVVGTSPVAVSLQSPANRPVYMFEFAAEGETPECYIFGRRTGDAKRSLQIGVGVDAADTASFDGVSSYHFDGAINSATLDLSVAGPTDDLNITGVNTVFINTSGNNVTIGGFVGGVNGQELRVVVIDASNNTILEHAEGTGNQDIYLHAGADEILDAHYGGWNLVCNGTHWYDESHAKHV